MSDRWVQAENAFARLRLRVITELDCESTADARLLYPAEVERMLDEEMEQDK